MQSNYTVKIKEYAERHFIKSFEKKYKQAWEVTLNSIVAELERIDNLLETDRADTVCHFENIRIIKTEFRIATTKESAKTSGNRSIVAINVDTKKVSVLLVYTKTDIDGSNETSWWKNLVKDNYPEYKGIIGKK